MTREEIRQSVEGEYIYASNNPSVRVEQVKFLLSKIKELEEENKGLRMVDTRHGVKLVDRLRLAETRVKELEERIQSELILQEAIETTRDDALAYAKMFKRKLEELEKGIEKHKIKKIDGRGKIFLDEVDEELHKLIEKEK